VRPDLANRVHEASERHLGVPVLYTPVAGAPFSLNAHFDARGVKVSIDGITVEGIAPMLGVRFAAMPAMPQEDDQWQVGGVTYRVVDIQPDGPGTGASLFGELA
jgi:hypothetical protein